MTEGCPDEDRWFVVDVDGFAFALPCSLKPNYWLGSLHPSVHGYALGQAQMRTDDYVRDAQPLELEGTIYAASETEMHLLAGNIRAWVRRARWLQRGQRSSLELLEGSDIELVPLDAVSKMATLKVVVVASKRQWVNPATGQEVTG